MHDLTAAVLYGEYKGVNIIIPHCWFPVVAAHEKAEKDNIPLFGWQDDGWLTMCNTPTTEYSIGLKTCGDAALRLRRSVMTGNSDANTSG